MLTLYTSLGLYSEFPLPRRSGACCQCGECNIPQGPRSPPRKNESCYLECPSFADIDQTSFLASIAIAAALPISLRILWHSMVYTTWSFIQSWKWSQRNQQHARCQQCNYYILFLAFAKLPIPPLKIREMMRRTWFQSQDNEMYRPTIFYFSAKCPSLWGSAGPQSSSAPHSFVKWLLYVVKDPNFSISS